MDAWDGEPTGHYMGDDDRASLCGECDGDGEIEVYRTSFTHGLNAWTGCGDPISDYIQCHHCRGTGREPSK